MSTILPPISEQQVHTLLAMPRKGWIKSAELARDLKVASTSADSALRRMVPRGYVTQDHDSKEWRVTTYGARVLAWALDAPQQKDSK